MYRLKTILVQYFYDYPGVHKLTNCKLIHVTLVSRFPLRQCLCFLRNHIERTVTSLLTLGFLPVGVVWGWLVLDSQHLDVPLIRLVSFCHWAIVANAVLIQCRMSRHLGVELCWKVEKSPRMGLVLRCSLSPLLSLSLVVARSYFPISRRVHSRLNHVERPLSHVSVVYLHRCHDIQLWLDLIFRDPGVWTMLKGLPRSLRCCVVYPSVSLDSSYFPTSRHVERSPSFTSVSPIHLSIGVTS